MAQPDLESFTSRAVVIGAEITEGVDPTLTPAANTFQLLDGKSGTEFDKIERKVDRPFFSGDPFAVANKRAFIEGMFELIPPVTPGHVTNGHATASVVLEPAGMAETLNASGIVTRYNPISKLIPSAAAYWWHAGTLRKVLGSRANITGLALAIGERFKANLRLQGQYTTINEDSLPNTSDYSAFLAPTICTAENTKMLISTLNGGTTNLHLWGKSLSIDFGSSIGLKQYTELRHTGITDRKPTFTARFARTAKADFDAWAIRDAGVDITLTFRLVEPDGRYSLLAIRGQIEKVDEVDQDGDYNLEISGPCIASDTGGDEFYIEFGNTTFRLVGTLPGAAAGAYSHSLTLGGDYTLPIAYTVGSGSLPTGTTLNAVTGVVSGNAVAGNYTFVIHAVETGGHSCNSTSQNVVIT